MSTAGETSLATLLSSLSIAVSPSTYVWITIPPSTSSSSSSSTTLPIPPSLMVMTFQEPATNEHGPSTTIVTTLDTATVHGLPYQYPSRMVTCAVHSSLEAVGFLAVLTRHLADAGISCNPVSAYFHDHLFVPADRVDDAVEVLERLAKEARMDEHIKKNRDA